MTKLPYDRLAAFSLGVMTTVLLLAPSAKAFCSVGKSISEIASCYEQERRIDKIEHKQRMYEMDRMNESFRPGKIINQNRRYR